MNNTDDINALKKDISMLRARLSIIEDVCDQLASKLNMDIVIVPAQAASVHVIDNANTRHSDTDNTVKLEEVSKQEASKVLTEISKKASTKTK